MAAGMVVGDLSAVAEVGNLWGEAEENFGGGRKSKSHVPQEARDVEHRVEGDDGCITWEKKAKAAGRNARATRSITGKRRGEMAEAVFVAKAAELGFGIAKPWGDSDPYDFIVPRRGQVVAGAGEVGASGGGRRRVQLSCARSCVAGIRTERYRRVGGVRCSGECVVCVSSQCGAETALVEAVFGQSKKKIEVRKIPRGMVGVSGEGSWSLAIGREIPRLAKSARRGGVEQCGLFVWVQNQRPRTGMSAPHWALSKRLLVHHEAQASEVVAMTFAFG